MAVDAPGGHVLELGGKLRGRQRPVTEEGFDDAKPHRVQEDIRARHSTEGYTLRLFAARIRPGEAAAMTPDEHAQAFMAYVAGLLTDFDHYLAAGPPDPVRDGADYRVGAMWLSDAEFAEFLRDFAAVAQPRLANGPGKGRRRRMVYTVFLPAPDKPDGDGTPRHETRPPSRRSKRSS